MSIQTIYAALVRAGMSPVGACAMMGNMQDESAMLSTNVENRSGIDDAEYTRMVDAGGYDFATDNGRNYGYGLCQWTLPARKRNLLNFARSHGVSVGNEDMQVAFAIHELQTEPEYRKLWMYLTTATGIYEAAERICKEYERPAETVINTKERAAYANQFYMQFGGMELPPTQETTTPPTISATPEQEIFYTPATETVIFWPPRTLDLNMFGGDVAALHGMLVAHGYNAPLSWTFDIKTRAMVMAFQAEHDLDADGICGPVTWNALLERG